MLIEKRVSNCLDKCDRKELRKGYYDSETKVRLEYDMILRFLVTSLNQKKFNTINE